MDYAKVIDEIFSQVTGVRFGIRLWDDRKLEYGTKGKRAFTLVFNDELSARRLLSQGSLGFGESYMDGSLQVEGDLEAYLRLRNQFRTIKPSPRLAAAAFVAGRATPKKTQDQIAYHYDFGNDFFGLFLDSKTMSYSCGLYETGTESLDAAQQKKIELVCKWLNLPAGAKILDLGCGWGGFAIYAAKTYGWEITSCTLSNEQRRYCEQLVKKQKMQKKIAIEFRDMLTDLPPGQFDAIVMLESIEHVGKKRLNTFITTLHSKVKPGGLVYIQTSGRYKPKPLDRWTNKYVFPGGHLPSQQELVDDATKAGFKLNRFIDDASDYALTIGEWARRIEANQQTIENMYNTSTYRLWQLWIHGAKAGFEAGSMGLFRIMLQRPIDQDS